MLFRVSKKRERLSSRRKKHSGNVLVAVKYSLAIASSTLFILPPKMRAVSGKFHPALRVIMSVIPSTAATIPTSPAVIGSSDFARQNSP